MKRSKFTTPWAYLLFGILLLGAISCGERAKEKIGVEQPVAEAPEQIISVEQAQGMYKNYSERRAPLIQRYEDSIMPGTKFDVARYVYYDYATVKQYMAYIEQVAQEAGVEISTLRFYFSNYPNEEKFPDGKEVKHPRQNSMFIIPTLKQDADDYGFYTREGAEGKWVPVLLNGQMQPYQPNGMGLMQDQTTRDYAGFFARPAAVFQNSKGTILNEGGSAPPPYK